MGAPGDPIGASAVARNVAIMRMTDAVQWAPFLHPTTGQPGGRECTGPWHPQRGALAGSDFEVERATVVGPAPGGGRWGVTLWVRSSDSKGALLPTCVQAANGPGWPEAWPDCDKAQQSVVEMLAGYDDDVFFRVGNGFMPQGADAGGGTEAATARLFGERQYRSGGWVNSDQLSSVLIAYAAYGKALRSGR